MQILLMSAGIVAIFALGLYALLATPKTGKFNISQNNELSPLLRKLLKMFGGDILGIVSYDTIKRGSKNTQLDRLFKDSGNPWKITKEEFFVIKLLLGGAGIFTGILILIIGIVELENQLLAFVGLIGSPILLFFLPNIVYNSEATERQNKFKSELPEAIDYLVMALSGGGYSLPSAFEECVKYMKSGLVKDEFTRIVNDLKAGKTMEETLNDFANRAPSDNIKSFTTAVINANKLSVSMVDIMRAKSKSARKDLEIEIEKRVSVLSTKVTLILSPVAIFSIMLIAIAPPIFMIIKMI